VCIDHDEGDENPTGLEIPSTFVVVYSCHLLGPLTFFVFVVFGGYLYSFALSFALEHAECLFSWGRCGTRNRLGHGLLLIVLVVLFVGALE
jgi:hypothetical protein